MFDLRKVLRNERLVGGDDVLACFDRTHDDILGRRSAAHHLAHKVNGGIRQDFLNVLGDCAFGRHRKVALLRLVTHADRSDLHVNPQRLLQLAGLAEDVDDASADSASADEPDLHLARHARGRRARSGRGGRGVEGHRAPAGAEQRGGGREHGEHAGARAAGRQGREREEKREMRGKGRWDGEREGGRGTATMREREREGRRRPTSSATRSVLFLHAEATHPEMQLEARARGGEHMFSPCSSVISCSLFLWRPTTALFYTGSTVFQRFSPRTL
eukprot:scaffold60132_cov27-Tisochrysis_lutea.AAC.1